MDVENANLNLENMFNVESFLKMRTSMLADIYVKYPTILIKVLLGTCTQNLERSPPPEFGKIKYALNLYALLN